MIDFTTIAASRSAGLTRAEQQRGVRILGYRPVDLAGRDMMSTFGNREMEVAAIHIVNACARSGSGWSTGFIAADFRDADAALGFQMLLGYGWLKIREFPTCFVVTDEFVIRCAQPKGPGQRPPGNRRKRRR